MFKSRVKNEKLLEDDVLQEKEVEKHVSRASTLIYHPLQLRNFIYVLDVHRLFHPSSTTIGDKKTDQIN